MSIHTVGSVDIGLASRASQEFERRWHEWHQRHEELRAGRHGFLAVTSLNFLNETPQRFPDAPGAWSTHLEGVRVVLAEGEEIIVNGARVGGEHRFGVIPERQGITVGWGDAVIEVAKRGGFDIVRPRHPDHALRVKYPGTPAFAPDPRWAIFGRYVAFDTPVPTRVGAAVEGLEHVYHAPGRVEFVAPPGFTHGHPADDSPLTLTVFPGYTPGSLFALFTDLTSGVTTYGANRSLAINAPTADGLVWLDFNRATNLPCAYTPYATCPLPPPENRLPIAIEAGEKTPV